MNKKLLLIVFLLILVLVQGCKKGDTGPQGPAGPQGIQGVKGDNGSMIYSGNDVPAASLGGMVIIISDCQIVCFMDQKQRQAGDLE